MASSEVIASARMMRVLVLSLLLASCARAEPEIRKDAVPTVPSASAKLADSTPIPLELACKSDDDCTYDYRYIVDGKCCGGTCSPRPVAASYVPKADARCKELGYAKERCPVKKCVEPPPLRCAAGTCSAL